MHTQFHPEIPRIRDISSSLVSFFLSRFQLLSSYVGDFLRVEKDGRGRRETREKREENNKVRGRGNMHNVNPGDVESIVAGARVSKFFTLINVMSRIERSSILYPILHTRETRINKPKTRAPNLFTRFSLFLSNEKGWFSHSIVKIQRVWTSIVPKS